MNSGSERDIVAWETLRIELMDALAVSELPKTSMTCATLRALLDVLSIDMTREEARALIADSLNAFGAYSDGRTPPSPG
jgi:hypothetical protein